MANLIMRDQWETRMNTGTAQHPIWSLLGEGFTSLSEVKKPREYTYQHFDEPVEYTDVVGYSTSLAYSVDAYSDNPSVAVLIRAAHNELTGKAARRDIICINKWDAAAPGIYRAYRRTYAIIPGSSADNVGIMTYSGNLHAAGPLIPGLWDAENSTFIEVGYENN